MFLCIVFVHYQCHNVTRLVIICIHWAIQKYNTNMWCTYIFGVLHLVHVYKSFLRLLKMSFSLTPGTSDYLYCTHCEEYVSESTFRRHINIFPKRHATRRDAKNEGEESSSSSNSSSEDEVVSHSQGIG